jgi:hypothetical protein
MNQPQPGDVIDAEHDRRLDDADLIDAICECEGITRAQWDALPREEQVARQLAFVEPMPRVFR